MSERWTWPAGRALVLYEWVWFDTQAGEVVGGWSQRGEVDDHGFVHLEEQSGRAAWSVQPDSEGSPIVARHVFTALTRFPILLYDEEDRPFPWIRKLLGEE